MNTEYSGAGERVADECDFAANLAIAETANHLRKKQAEIANIFLDPEFDGIHCVECGEKIPKARREALFIEIPDDGSVKIRQHPTNSHHKKGGHSFVRKHGSDKCMACQSEISRVNSIKGRQRV